MNCPKCHGTTIVVDSRPYEWEDHECVRRRRKCEKCGARFSTLEVIAGRFGETKLHPVMYRWKPVTVHVTFTETGKVLVSERKLPDRKEY